MSSSSKNTGSYHKSVAILTAHPWLVLGVFVFLTAVLGWQAGNFKVDASAETLLLKDNENFINTQLVNQRFAPQEFLLIAYEPKSHPLFSQQTYDDLDAISAEILEMDRVASVRSILNVPLLSLADADLSSDLDPNQFTLTSLQPDPDQLSQLFAGHPIYENLIVDEEQTATALQVLFIANEQLQQLQQEIIALRSESLNRELDEAEQIQLELLEQQQRQLQDDLNATREEEIETIRNLLIEYEASAELYLSGVHVLGYQLVNIIKNDLVVFGSAIAAIVSLILLLTFRELRWVLIPLLCCGVSVTLTLGLFGLLGLRATVISANFVALQLILTLAIVIHLIVQYQEYQQQSSGETHRSLVKKTLQNKISPCFYAGLTTSVGFGSLLLSNIQPVISFGWMMIIAVFISILVSLVLFPALMLVMPAGKKRSKSKISTAIVSGLSKASIRYGFVVVTLCLTLLAMGITGIRQLSVENSFLNYFRDSTQVKKELTFIDQKLGGTTPLDITYLVPSADEDENLVLTAETVQLLQQIDALMADITGTGKILSLVNFTELAKNINDGIPLTEYELTALYAILDESLRDDLVGSYFDADSNQLRMNIRIQDSTENLNRSELINSIRSSMDDAGVDQDSYQLTGLFVLYQDILQRLFNSQITTLGLVYIALTLAFVLVFRSLKLAIVGVVPNILSTLLILGTMGWFGIPLDLMTITIASITMGIAVDDTIHYLHRYLQELRNNDAIESIKLSHKSVGLAMLYTSVIIAIGFAMLSFSDFVPSVLFGLLTGLAMIVALLANLALLPVLLRKFVISVD